MKEINNRKNILIFNFITECKWIYHTGAFQNKTLSQKKNSKVITLKHIIHFNLIYIYIYSKCNDQWKKKHIYNNILVSRNPDTPLKNLDRTSVPK